MDGDAPVGVTDSAVVAVGVVGGVSAGLVPPGLGLPSSVGLRSPGVGPRSSGVGEAEAVAVDFSVGVAVGGCATETAAPTTVSSAAAAQMIWARRRKLETLRRRSATMERDYRPGAMAADYHPANSRAAAVRPEPATEGGPRSGGAGPASGLCPRRRMADVVSRAPRPTTQADNALPKRSQPVAASRATSPWTALALMTVSAYRLPCMFLNVLTSSPTGKRSSTRSVTCATNASGTSTCSSWKITDGPVRYGTNFRPKGAEPTADRRVHQIRAAAQPDLSAPSVA